MITYGTLISAGSFFLIPENAVLTGAVCNMEETVGNNAILSTDPAGKAVLLSIVAGAATGGGVVYVPLNISLSSGTKVYATGISFFTFLTLKG